MKLIGIIILIGLQATAQNLPCTPWSEIRVTEQGLPKVYDEVISLVLANLEIRGSEGMTLPDYSTESLSKCNAIDSNVAHFSETIKTCPMAPDLKTELFPVSSTQWRPWKMQISDLRTKKLKIVKKGPVQCQDDLCQVQLEAKEVVLQGFGRLNFRDGQQELLIPKTAWDIQALAPSENGAQLTLKFKVHRTSHTIDQIVVLPRESTQLNIPDGSLRLHIHAEPLSLNKNEMFQKIANQELKNIFEKLTRVEYARQELSLAKMQLSLQLRRDREKARKIQGLADESLSTAVKTSDLQTTIEMNGADLTEDALIHFKFISLDQLSESYKKLPSVQTALAQISVLVDSKLAGFERPAYYQLTRLAEIVGSKTLEQQSLAPQIMDFIKPKLQSAIEMAVSESLRDLPRYLAQLNKLPGLNLQLLVNASDLKAKIDENQNSLLSPSTNLTAAQRLDLEKTRNDLSLKYQAIMAQIRNNWFAVQSTILINSNDSGFNGIIADVVDNRDLADNSCRHFELAETKTRLSASENFDASIEISKRGFQEYLNYLYKNENLVFCYAANKNKILDYNSCLGGLKIKLEQLPILGCDDLGDFIFDTKANIVHIGIVNLKLKGHFEACHDGELCLSLTSLNAVPTTTGLQFLNFVAKLTPFGGIDTQIQKSVVKGIDALNASKISFPTIKILEIQKNSATCNTRFNFALDPSKLNELKSLVDPQNQ